MLAIEDANNKVRETRPLWKKRRYLVVLLAFFGFINIYTLRINLSIGIVAMTENRTVEHSDGSVTYEQYFDWNSKQQGLVLSSFFYGYIFTQVDWLTSLCDQLKDFSRFRSVYWRLRRVESRWHSCIGSWNLRDFSFDFAFAFGRTCRRWNLRCAESRHGPGGGRHVPMHASSLVQVGSAARAISNGEHPIRGNIRRHGHRNVNLRNNCSENRLGVGLLRVWRDRLCLVCPVVFACARESRERSAHKRRGEAIHHAESEASNKRLAEHKKHSIQVNLHIECRLGHCRLALCRKLGGLHNADAAAAVLEMLERSEPSNQLSNSLKILLLRR